MKYNFTVLGDLNVTLEFSNQEYCIKLEDKSTVYDTVLVKDGKILSNNSELEEALVFASKGNDISTLEGLMAACTKIARRISKDSDDYASAVLDKIKDSNSEPFEIPNKQELVEMLESVGLESKDLVLEKEGISIKSQDGEGHLNVNQDHAYNLEAHGLVERGTLNTMKDFIEVLRGFAMLYQVTDSAVLKTYNKSVLVQSGNSYYMVPRNEFEETVSSIKSVECPINIKIGDTEEYSYEYLVEKPPRWVDDKDLWVKMVKRATEEGKKKVKYGS